MQQLSLFDFGEEKPKESKKKNTSTKEKTENVSSADLFADEEKEIVEESEIVDDANIQEDLSTDFIIEELENENVEEEESSILVPPADEEKFEDKSEEEIQDKEDVVSDEEEKAIEEKTASKKRGRKSFKEIDKEVDLIDVPDDEVLFQKQYYPISTVAKWFRVNTSLLRFWENQFKILKPKKNKKGDRFFRPEDVKNLKLIYYLLRQKKLTIDGANKHLKAHKEQTEENMQLINSLNNVKSFLLELKANTV